MLTAADCRAELLAINPAWEGGSNQSSGGGCNTGGPETLSVAVLLALVPTLVRQRS